MAMSDTMGASVVGMAYAKGSVPKIPRVPPNGTQQFTPPLNIASPIRSLRTRPKAHGSRVIIPEEFRKPTAAIPFFLLRASSSSWTYFILRLDASSLKSRTTTPSFSTSVRILFSRSSFFPESFHTLMSVTASSTGFNLGDL